MGIKIALVIISLFSLYQMKKVNDLDNELLIDQKKADSLETVILVSDSIIMSIKSEFLIALKQVHKDSINVENFKKNKPKQLKGLNREELNAKFRDYFNRIRTK